MTKDKKNGTSTPTKTKSGGGGKSIVKDIDIKDCPLTLERVHQADVSKISNYLKKDGADSIGLDDLNSLQFQLEAALVTTVTRKLFVRDELDILNNIDKHKGGRKLAGSASSGKRATNGSSSSGLAGAKKLKLNSGKPLDKTGKTKPSFDQDDDDILKPVVGPGSGPGITSPQQSFMPKNDTPQRFWNFVEPYCAPIQASDVKFLEDLIKGYSEIGEFYKIPGLGPHYSIRWVKEDLEREQNKSSEASEDDKSTSAAGPKFEGKHDTVPFGDLTQRLIQGLLEEKTTSSEDNVERSLEQCGSRNSFIQSLKVAPEDSLEKQIKKELEEAGILSAEETENQSGGSEGGDEVLAELERCQAELKAVSAHNLSQLRNLANLARVEMTRQEVRSRLEEVDMEVKEAYARISSARVKKRALTKKEKDSAWKSIKDREVILKQLESI